MVVQESLGHHGVSGVDHRVVHLGDEGDWDGTVIFKEVLVMVVMIITGVRLLPSR